MLIRSFRFQNGFKISYKKKKSASLHKVPTFSVIQGRQILSLEVVFFFLITLNKCSGVIYIKNTSIYVCMTFKTGVLTLFFKHLEALM